MSATGTPEIVSRIRFQPEEVLPLQLVREHTKTDDTPTVTDAVLELYREVAFEQAELYTGRIILGSASVQETFRIDVTDEYNKRRRPNPYRKLILSYAPMEKFVLVGGKSRQNIRTRPNSRELEIAHDQFNLDMGNCCAGNGLSIEQFVLYSTGYKSKEDIPSTMLYGCLKFIAWSINNPGDELLTVRNRLGTTETGLIGTNNAAWGSGAIEHWKPYKVKR